jgi:hypothetical protein
VYVGLGRLRLGQQDVADSGFFHALAKVNGHLFENRGQVKNFHTD